MPAVVWFTLAFVLELMVTGKLFLQRKNLPLSFGMKWWAVASLGLMSVANMYAAIEVFQNQNLNQALITKFMFSFAGALLLLWVLVFHIDKWKAPNEPS